RELGHSRTSVCRALSGDVTAACRTRAAARAALEGAHRVNEQILRLGGGGLLRGARRILEGVTLDVRRSELVALMGPSGSGKTTILRTICALEPFESGRIVVDDVTLESGGPAPASTLRRLR